MISLLLNRYTEVEKSMLYLALCEAKTAVKKVRKCNADYPNSNCNGCYCKNVCRDLKSSIDHIK